MRLVTRGNRNNFKPALAIRHRSSSIYHRRPARKDRLQANHRNNRSTNHTHLSSTAVINSIIMPIYRSQAYHRHRWVSRRISYLDNCPDSYLDSCLDSYLDSNRQHRPASIDRRR